MHVSDGLLRLRNAAMALIFSAAQYQYNIAAMEAFLRLSMAIERPQVHFYSAPILSGHA